MARVILIELVARQRFHRAMSFPFVQGWLRERGIDTQWFRYVLEPDARAGAAEPGVTLPDGLRGDLLRRLSEKPPSHAIFFPAPSPSLVHSVRRLLPALQVGVAAEADPREAELSGSSVVEASARAVAAFLGAQDGEELEASLYDSVTPDYGWIAAHEPASREASLPFLVCGEECSWNRSLHVHPFFQGLDLSGCRRSGGCAFCRRGGGTRRWARTPPELLRIQLEALHRTHPSSATRLWIRAAGEPAFRHVEAAARLLLEVELEPCDLLLDARADLLLACRDSVERALTALAGSGHTLQLCLLGIESFAAHDLELMNKGVTWSENLDAIAALFDWESRFPDCFGFRKHGGLSLLWYHPWTRLQDLSLNYALVRRCLLERTCGKAFSARLRLYSDLGWYPAVLRDGLVRERCDDAFLETARRNFYPDEIPWAFSDPRIESVNRLLVRMEPGACPPDDPRADAARRLSNAFSDALEAAEAVIDAAMESAIPNGVEQLASAALDGLARIPAPECPGEGLLPPEVIGVLAGLKPVGRLETLGAAPRLPAIVAESGLESVQRQRSGERSRFWDTFIARDRAAIERVMSLVDCADPDTTEEAARGIGELLGYPECCARAFAATPQRLRDSYGWMLVMRRLEEQQASPWLHPGCESLVNWVPCSVHCEASIAYARAMLEAVKTWCGAHAARQICEDMQRPWLLSVDHDGSGVALELDGAPEGRVKYRAGKSKGDPRLFRVVARGEELEIDEQQILVLSRGRVVGALGGRAMLWWNEAPVQPELWRRLLRLRYMPGAGRAEFDRPQLELSSPKPGPTTKLVTSLLRASGLGARYGAYQIATIEADYDDVARVTLRGRDGAFPILIGAGRNVRDAFVTAGPLSVYHRREHPIDTPARQLAVHALARALRAAIARRLAAR